MATYTKETDQVNRQMSTPTDTLLSKGDITRNEIQVEYEEVPDKLIYNISENPPVHMAIFFAFQQALLALAGSLAVSTLVADVACASEFPDIRTDLLSSTLFMNGITTLLMVSFGIRLPLFQGAAADYIVPLMAVKFIDKNFCDVPLQGSQTENINEVNLTLFNSNGTTFSELTARRNLAIFKLQQFQGCIMLTGFLHFLVGATGMIGILLKFVGPVTIVPTVFMSGIYVSKATAVFAKSHWGLAYITAAVSLLLSLYLGHLKMPFPAWTKTKGFHVFWYPLHQVFSILIGILVGWMLAAILTHTGLFTEDRTKSEFYARTDARDGIVSNATWFRFPEPNPFGKPSFHIGIFISFIIGTMVSILDSIGDYYACARICNAPPPPKHGVNRGIAVEGFCTILSGVVGCGHATSTYGGNIGAIGITKVASRNIFLWVGVIYIVFGVVGKLSAAFITIPNPVLGGAMIVMYGMFNGVILSNLQAVSLNSNRNLAIIGTGILNGLMIPYWLESSPGDVNTGNIYNDNIIKTIFSNPNLCCGVVTCFLDNTVPGTDKERGLLAWNEPGEEDTSQKYSEEMDVYSPLIPTKWLSWSFMKYIPIFPFKPRNNEELTANNVTKD